MNAKVKTITKKAVIVIAGSLGLLLLFFALLIGLVCCIAVDKAPSSRELCKRMNDYYGERFTKVSQEELGGEHSVMYYTFRDSSGLECHVVCGRVELTPGKWIYSVLDDYSVSRIAQTPAVQRLLAQSAFKVQDTSGFENGDLSEFDQCFSYPIPDKRLCSYVISVDNYADIADALQLSADTVNAADSRVSFRRDESEQAMQA